MIYFQIATIVVAAIGLLVYVLLFERRYFFGLLVAEILCTGFLSFYIFYYIGSYNSSDNDVHINANLNNLGSGLYSLLIDVGWKHKPEIFGFDGNSDKLIVRYNPQMFEIVNADRKFSEAELGKCLVRLSDDFKYSNISKSEKEICFEIKDGEDMNTKVDIKELKPGGSLKVYLLHDYKIPLGSSVYWEKSELIELK